MVATAKASVSHMVDVAKGAVQKGGEMSRSPVTSGLFCGPEGCEHPGHSTEEVRTVGGKLLVCDG